jgi:hypothetical protein
VQQIGTATRLPLAQHAVAHGTPPDVVRVNFARGCPILPDAVAAGVRDEWNVDIRHQPDGIDAGTLRAFTATLAQARCEQIVRALSRDTNLVLPGASVLVIGGGPLAATFIRVLDRLGSRVTVGASDPAARLQSQLLGLATVYPAAVKGWNSDFIIFTGEDHARVRPDDFNGTLVDASMDGGVLGNPRAFKVTTTRLRAVGNNSWILDAPSPVPSDLTPAGELEWHIVDLIVALALLFAALPPGGSGSVETRAVRADTALARLLLR